MSRLLTLFPLLLVGCGQSEAEAWTAFCDAPSACTRPADLGDVSDEAREARTHYIECVMGQVNSTVRNDGVRRTYLAAIESRELDRVESATRAAGLGACPMLDLIREDP